MDMAEYIRQAAAARGMDPDAVLEVVRTEGGLSDPFQQSFAKKNGIREPSYGPFQLLVGGEGTGFPEGLGNVALSRGIDPRKDWQGGIDLALDTAAKEGWGQWYGPKNAGLSRWHGIKDGARALGTSLNSNPIASGGYASEGPMQEAHNRVVQPLSPPRTIADRPIGTSAPAMTTDPGSLNLEGLMAKLKTPDAAGGFDDMLAAMGGGGSSGSSAPQIQPTGFGAAVASENAARMVPAQQLMAALLAKKRGKVPGLSLMG
jgi:hypothetical protein